MGEDEALREALLELKALREREAASLKNSNALLDGLACITDAETPSEALSELLSSIRQSVDCAVALLIVPGEGGPSVRLATEAALAGSPVPTPMLKQERPARIVDTARLDWWSDVSEPLAAYRSILSVPIALSDGKTGAILCLSTTPARFTTSEQRLLTRLSGLASQALATLALSERNALLAGVIDGASASVAIADVRIESLPLIYVNDAFLDLTGYSREEALGQNCRFLSAEAPDSPERARLRQAVATRTAGTFELMNRRRDGTLFLNRLTLFPIGDAEGPRYLVATQVDITAERAATEERDAARRRLISALSVTSEGFLLLDPSGRVVYANPRYRDFFEGGEVVWTEGVAFADMWARRLVELGVAPSQAKRRARARQAALFGGGRDREETLPDGRILLINDRPTADSGAVSIATDITSIKSTERMLAQRAAAIDASQDGIAVTDEEGRFVYMNPAHLAMFGYQVETDVLGRPWTMLYSPEQAAVIERVGMPELRRHGTWRTEITGRTRTGEPVAQEVSLTLLPGIGLVCVTRGIAERHRNERERARLRDQLHSAQRQEAIGQLAAGVAHDFNNLLSVISASTAMVETDLEPAHPAQKHLARVTAAAGRATELVTRLLDLGGRKTTRVRLDGRTVLAEAADLLRAGVPTRIAVRTEQPDAAVQLDVDHTELLQVLLNLGINARDAIGQDAGEVVLSLDRICCDGDRETVIGTLEDGIVYAQFTVMDTGSGMTPEATRKIFRPYFTTKGVDGTGLGLAVVSSLATKAKAAVSVASAPGRGTRFDVFWPVTGSALESESEALASPPDEDATEDLRGSTIIVCDDMPDVGHSLAAILEQAGAEVSICEHPEDALHAIEEDPLAWSVLVTDYDMPGMDGTSLAKAARHASPALPIVLCTALAEGRLHASLFDATVKKPVMPAQLLTAVRKAMVKMSGGDDNPGAQGGSEEGREEP